MRLFDSVFAPRTKQQANGRPALIEEAMPLPSFLLLRSKSYLEQLYSGPAPLGS